MKLKIVFVVLVIVLLGLLWGVVETKFIRVKRYAIESPKLSGLKIAFLSDFHYKSRWDDGKIKRAIRKVNREKPDIIILGGDYTEDVVDHLDTVFRFFSELKAPLGIYLVTGNHDYMPGMSMRINRLMTKYQIQSLNNRSFWLDYQGSRFKLGGIPDISHEEPELAATISDVTEEDLVLLISHQPDFIMELTDEERSLIDVLVSGHTHGGQMTIFGYAHYIPSKYGQRFRSGLVDMEPTKLIVSNGVGETRLPLRFFAPAEVVIIQFK